MLGHGLGDFLAAIAGIDAPHAADAVEIAPALGVLQVAPVTLNQNERPFLPETIEMRVGMKEMIVVFLPEIVLVEAVASLTQHDCPLILTERSFNIKSR